MQLRKKYELKNEVTLSELMKLLKTYFGEKYEIYETSLIGADFVIKNTWLEGIACKLKSKNDKKIFLFWRMAPSYWGRQLFAGILALSKSKKMYLVLNFRTINNMDLEKIKEEIERKKKENRKKKRELLFKSSNSENLIPSSDDVIKQLTNTKSKIRTIDYFVDEGFTVEEIENSIGINL